jgi:hypothetical protein
MIRAWMAGLAGYSLACVALAVAAVAEAFNQAPLWVPQDVVRWAAVGFVSGPLLAFFIAGLGPRAPGAGRDLPGFDRRLARRVMGVGVLVLVVPIGLLTAILTDAAIGGALALTSAALLMILAPWMALYVRWFNGA